MTRAPFSFCPYNAGLDCHVLRVHSGAVLNSPNQTQQWLIFVGQMAVIQVGMWCQRAFFWYIFIFSWLAKKVSAWTLEQSGVSCFSSGEINNTEQTYELWTVEKVLSWKFFFFHLVLQCLLFCWRLFQQVPNPDAAWSCSTRSATTFWWEKDGEALIFWSWRYLLEIQAIFLIKTNITNRTAPWASTSSDCFLRTQLTTPVVGGSDAHSSSLLASWPVLKVEP